MFTIRPAEADDWAPIEAFLRPIMTEGRTYAIDPDLDDEWYRSWWIEEPPARTLVAVDGDGAVCGTVKMGPNRPARGAHIATASFLVDPAHRGKGVARVLGEALLDWASAEGYRGIQFNAVVETNHAAVHLWQSLGFAVIGTVPEAFDHPDHGLVGLHVMYRPV